MICKIYVRNRERVVSLAHESRSQFDDGIYTWLPCITKKNAFIEVTFSMTSNVMKYRSVRRDSSFLSDDAAASRGSWRDARGI